MLWIFSMVALAADVWAPGETIPEAISLQVTEQGFDAVEALVPALVPTDPLALDPISDSGGLPAFCLGYEYDFVDGEVGLEIISTDLVPSAGVLNVEIDALVRLNDAGNPFYLGGEVACLDIDCPGYVEPFPITLTLPMGLQIITDGAGNKQLDATLGTISLTNALQNSDVQLDCGIQTVEDALAIVGLSIYDLIIDFAESFLVSEIESQAADIELLIEDAFSAVSIEEQLELNGAVVDLQLQPADVIVAPEGLELLLESSVTATPASCTDAYDVDGGSPKTPSTRPGLASHPAGTQVVGLLSDDTLDQTMYALWRGGALCVDLSEGGLEGIPLDTSLLTLLGGEPFEQLFPETKPIAIMLEPTQPPKILPSTQYDLEVDITGTGVAVYAELDGRQARVLGLGLSPEIGLETQLDPATGELALDLVIPSDLGLDFTGDPLILERQRDDVLATANGALGGLLDTLLGSLLGEALSFELPSFSGLGLTSLSIDPGGAQGDWAAATIELGPVSYTSEGCSEDGGSGGCATATAVPWLWVLCMGALIRRRR